MHRERHFAGRGVYRAREVRLFDQAAIMREFMHGGVMNARLDAVILELGAKA